MRKYVLLLAAVCLLHTSNAAADQAAGAAGSKPPAQAAQPAPATPNADKKEIKVSEKVLKAYVGVYEMAPDRILTITLENGYLHGQPTDQQKRQLYAETQTKFFLKDLPVVVTFQKDAKGVVTGLQMQQEGRPDRELKKVK